MSSSGTIIKTGIFLLVILLVISLGATLVINRDGIVPPHIERATAPDSLQPVTYSFPFEESTIKFSGSVDPAVYYGAKAADKETMVRGNISENAWLRETYLAMINDPAQDSFYSSLTGTFQSVRTRQRLDDDEYLELMATFVQSIPYESLSENPPKFPIETFADKSGDCDDKSLLLAGLLSREGYNVSLLSFGPEAHMAVGVACPGGEYRGTGYTYIETTNISFAGVPADTLGTGTRLVSYPLVFRIGNGTKNYGSCTESQYLNSVYNTSERRVAELTVQIDTLKEEMDRYYAQRDITRYNSRVPVYNNLQKIRLKYAEVHNYILEHQYDRKGTLRYVMANVPE